MNEMGWRDVACMRAIMFKAMMTKSNIGKQLGRPGSKRANKIEMDLKETGYIYLAQNKVSGGPV
jgi:hypothetical protein